MDILRLVGLAHWLTTSQVHRRFFAPASLSAARRCLRRLSGGGYLRKYQVDRMREALFTVGPAGKRFLEKAGTDKISVERRPPKQMEHMAGINDIRIAAELTPGLGYFFAAWELPELGWNHAILPDAVVQLSDRTFAVEYDRGLEGLRYFAGTKVARYCRGLSGFPLAAVLVVADRDVRMRALARTVTDDRCRFLFTTIDAIRKHNLRAPIFSAFKRSSGGLETCSVELFSREDSCARTTLDFSGSCKKNEGAS